MKALRNFAVLCLGIALFATATIVIWEAACAIFAVLRSGWMAVVLVVALFVLLKLGGRSW